MRLAVIVLNFRHARDTLACAASVMAQDPDLLVIVDNASNDDSWDLLYEFASQNGPFAILEAPNPEACARAAKDLPEYPAPRVLLVEAPENRGYAAGNNLGLAAAISLGADACWILNNDTLIGSGALSRVREAAAGGLDFFGTTVLNGRNGLVQCLGGGCTNYWSCLSMQAGQGLDPAKDALPDAGSVDARLNYICGASVVVSKKFLDRVGLMDEGFFLYCEEQDWAIRGAKAGFLPAYVPEASVTHYEGSTTGMHAGSRPISRMARLARSRIRLAAKHRPLAIPTVALALVFALGRIFLRRIFRKKA